jgi:hypothetical protein
MALARHGDDVYTVELADTAAQRAAVYALREETYVEGQAYLLASPAAGRHRAADVYDDRSYVFACRRGADPDPIATCRFTRPLGGRWELDDIAERWAAPEVPREALVETSRVVIRKDARVAGLAEAMLLMAGTWLLHETPYRFNFAVCARPLVRLYARLGMMRAGGDELVLRGRPADRRYVVIYGDMQRSRPGVVRRLSARGWRISAPPALARSHDTIGASERSERESVFSTRTRKAGTR